MKVLNYEPVRGTVKIICKGCGEFFFGKTALYCVECKVKQNTIQRRKNYKSKKKYKDEEFDNPGQGDFQGI